LASHQEILLGFIIGEKDEGSGEGATLRIHGLWVLPEEEEKGVSQVLLKGFVDRMRDGRVAKRIVKSMQAGLGDNGEEGGKEREMVLGWFRDAGFSVREGGGGQEGLRLVLDCF
jgi:GNAT superfamily N-acetyltransferase